MYGNTRINEHSKQIWTIYKWNRHVIKFDQPVPMAFNSLYCETSPNSCGSSGLFGWLGIPELCFLMSLPNPLLLYHHRRFLFVYVQQYDVTKGQENVLSLGFEEMFTAHCPPSNWGSELKLGYRKLSSSQLPVCLLPEWMGEGVDGDPTEHIPMHDASVQTGTAVAQPDPVIFSQSVTWPLVQEYSATWNIRGCEILLIFGGFK